MRPNWFVGLPVDGRGWLRPLLDTAPAGLRLFHPEDLHITVAFLGGCGPRAAERAWAEAVGCAEAPVELRLAGLAALGNPRRPSALSVLMAEDDGWRRAAALIEALRTPMCRAAGARPDTRPAQPHVTVARLPRKARPALRRQALGWTASRPPLDRGIVLDRLTLFTWADDRRVRQFRAAAERPLQAATGSAGLPPIDVGDRHDEHHRREGGDAAQTEVGRKAEPAR